MPIKITLRRGFNSLPWYRKLKLAWCLLTSDYKLTQEDIEELKRSDLLESMLKEFGSTFPEFKRVLIDERDMYLTDSLRKAYQPVPNEFVPGGENKKKIQFLIYKFISYLRLCASKSSGCCWFRSCERYKSKLD